MLVFYFIDTSISNMWTYFSISAFAWGQARSKLGGVDTSIFASWFYIDIYCIMGCYYTLCHNTYAFSLLFYKVYMKRENAGSWNSGLEKEEILETYSAQLQKSWNSTKVSFGIYKKYWAMEAPEGGHPLSTRVEGVPYPPGRAPCLVGHLEAPRCQYSGIWYLLHWKKS